MMDVNEAGSRRLAKGLERVVAHSSEMSAAQVLESLDGVLAEILPPLQGSSPGLALEAKRRVAEWKLKLVSEKDIEFEAVDQLRADLEQLGYTDLETEGTIRIVFSRYCIRVRRFADARMTLETLISRLEHALTQHEEPLYREMKAVSVRLLEDVESEK